MPTAEISHGARREFVWRVRLTINAYSIGQGVDPICMYINKSADAKINAYSNGQGLGTLGMGFDPIRIYINKSVSK